MYETISAGQDEERGAEIERVNESEKWTKVDEAGGARAFSRERESPATK